MSWDTGLAGVALKIAATEDSPLRVMAGPGTGKTFAMKRRVARLLEEGVKPKRILAVTFTRTAAANVVKELEALGVPGCEDIRAGTLHSFCFGLLSKQDVFDYLSRIARPLISFNRSGVMQFEAAPLLQDLGSLGDFGSKRDCTKRIRAFEADWARLQSETPGWPTNATDKQFRDELLSWLKFHNAMLIGELVPEALRFLRNNPASPLLKAFDHVIVDEYQDLNKAEQVLLDLLAEHGDNSIVGDVDQSIYSFRYAHPEGIVQFNIVHEDVHDETLSQCRRCSKSIVAVADALIRNNHPPGAGPRLKPRPDNPEGEIHIVQWPNLDAESSGIAAFVDQLVNRKGYEAGDILILCPRRLIGYGIRDKLRGLDIPTHSFYHEEALETDDAQIAFALLTLLDDNQDRVALRFWLGFGSPSWLEGEYQVLKNHCENTGQSPWDALTELEAGSLRLTHTAKLVVRFKLLRTRLSKLDDLTGIELVDALFPEAEEWAQALRGAALLRLEDETIAHTLREDLVTRITQPEMPEEGKYVRIMSLHKSKGLSSRVVIVVGCIHGLIPFFNAYETPAEQKKTLLEQRRLFYVAITRSEELLVLSSVTSMERQLAHRIGASVSGNYGKSGPTIASQFLAELGPTAPRAVPGTDWQRRKFS
jgi:superfamily I DNA/RNA helicase